MVTRLKKVYKVFIQSFKLVGQYIKFSTIHLLREVPQSGKEVFFTLDDDRLFRDNDGSGRYAYLPLLSFAQAGYTVYFCKTMDFWEFCKLGVYGRLIYSIDRLKFVSQVPKNTQNMVYVFDEPHQELLSRYWKKKVYYNVLKPSFCKTGQMIWRPFFMHPYMYRFGMIKDAESLRTTDRRLRIFFAGDTTRGLYSNPEMKKKYNLIPRAEGVEAVLELKEKVTKITDLAGFLKIINGDEYRNACYLLSANGIHPKEWLGILSKSDFFICFPGTDMPMCHNTIESMSVGTIPIISYHDWFFPALEHKKNAIVYQGTREDLQKKIIEVLSMTSEEIAAMRRNVIEYYEQNLKNESFFKNFDNNKDRVCTVMLHPRLVCNDRENQAGRKLIDEIDGILNAQ